MRLLGIIPARGGSKGVPGKNIKSLGGKPLLQYTWETAKQSSVFSKIIVSSDNEDIINVSKNLGIEVPFRRPQSLSKDNSGSLGVVKHALEYFIECGEVYDAVCILQPTTPFRTVELITECFESFKTKKVDSIVSVREVPHQFHPNWVFEETELGYLNKVIKEPLISGRQELKTAYYRDGQIYITKSKTVLEHDSLYGEKTSFVVSSNAPYVNIDTMDDWKKAEQLLKENM